MGEATNKNFFSSLRKTAQATERGVQQLQNNFETNFTDRCSAAAVTKLIDLKKEAKELKEQARNCNLTIQQAGNEFDVFLNLAMSFIDKQTGIFTDIQTFMSQYGYTHGEEEAPVVKQEDRTNINEQENTDPSFQEHTPPCNAVSRSVSRTPKLEEFGLSQIMMRAINRAEKEGKCGIFSSKLSSEKADVDNAVPSIFQHNGLVVTPSIMNGKTLNCTPSLNRKVDHIKTGSAMPDTPEFVTPFSKQKIHKGAASQSNYPNTELGSPELPLFHTPSMNRRFQKEHLENSTRKCRYETPPKMASLYSSSEMPQSPELTCNFQALSDVTGTYMSRETKSAPVVSVLSGIVKPSLITNTFPEMPQTPELTCNFQKSYPDEPRLLAEFRHSETKIVTPEIESFSSKKELPVVESGIAEKIYAHYSSSTAPATPQFHLNYR